MSRPVRVALRANAEPSLGGGHVMRCMSLARALERAGAETLLLANEPAFEIVAGLQAAARMCGETPEATVAAVRRHWPGGADVAVVDIYAWGGAEERVLRECARKLVAIDDLADRTHEADLVIDQTYGRAASAYAGLARRAIVLAGADYTMMRPEFAALRARATRRRAENAQPRRILVSMGLTDVHGVTGKVVAALRQAVPDAMLEVLVTQRAQSLKGIRELAAYDPRVRLHVDVLDIADLMIECDVAIGGAGTTAWERCCLGLPSVMLIVADNQRLIAHNLDEAGAALAAETIGEAVRHMQVLWTSADRRGAVSSAATALIDGEGANRAAAAITALCAEEAAA